jgi:hypothetical protein
MKNKRFFSALLVFVFLLAVSVNETNAQIAKWSDQSDNLPGMVSNGEMLLLAGGGVLLIGGLVAVLIIKKKHDKKLESSYDDFVNFKTIGSINVKKNDNKNLTSLFNDINRASEYNEPIMVPDQMSVQLFARSNSLLDQNFSYKQGLSVGVKVRF